MIVDKCMDNVVLLATPLKQWFIAVPFKQWWIQGSFKGFTKPFLVLISLYEVFLSSVIPPIVSDLYYFVFIALIY